MEKYGPGDIMDMDNQEQETQKEKIKPPKTNIYDSKDTTQTEYAIDVAAGAYHTLVLKSDGTVWTTGYNGYGQLGTGTTQSETEFKQATGIPEKVIAITANVHTSYALTESGKVYGWGIQLLWTTWNKQ